MQHNSQYYKTNAGMVSFQQEIPPIDDSLAYDTMLYWDFPCYFADERVEHEYAKFRLADPKIKDAIIRGTDKYDCIELRCAFVKYVMAHLDNRPEFPLLRKNAQELKESVEGVNVERTLMELCIRDNDSFISTEALKRSLEHLEVPKMTTQKLSKIIKKVFGVEKCRGGRGDSRGKWGYNLSSITDENPQL